MDLARLIDRYCEAWSEHDEARRAELLLSVWAPGALHSAISCCPRNTFPYDAARAEDLRDDATEDHL